ncbi:hypothetical protein [Spirulina sp. 06S082]|uniref:hypothetical protein n=1 Tax=Spirulina sp. 06S082 TaxID=3110248 RepID=UPI002B20F874|nr:hypothetical protein [Spirulina sp. 06S082]MEA5468823.1 hypothetical protein [Spirulina sp. 06S082]
MTKKVMAMAVSEVLESLAMTRSRLNLRLPCPNFPSKRNSNVSPWLSVCSLFLSKPEEYQQKLKERSAIDLSPTIPVFLTLIDSN